MPGLCGAVHADRDFRMDRGRLLKMRDSLVCRGPDGSGEYVEGRAALASRRLPVFDLSESGRMPFRSPDGRYTIVSDGAVLNHRSLRASVDPPPGGFRSKTDAEVVLHLYASCGPAMLESLNGAFAFAIWDSEKGELFLARDRLGMKPLCYTVQDRAFYFASEEKALSAAGLASEFDNGCWPELMVFGYVAGERTPYHGVSRLLPGHYLLWREGEYRVKRWWNLGERVMALRECLPADPAEWLAATLSDAVGLCRSGEVPVGLLLSGGPCSAAIAACLAAQGASGLAAFTVRFDEDEGGRAQAVAERCDLDYHELPLSAEEVIGLLEPAAWLDDLPVAHGFETQLLGITEYAKCRAGLLLSGMGGGQTLGAQARYGPAGRLRRWLAPSPRDLSLLFHGCDVLPPDVEALGGGPCHEFPFREEALAEARRLYPGEASRQAMYLDHQTYLPSLADRTDRMTEGASVECRLPLLDHRLVEGLAALPTSVLLGGRSAKSLLRHLTNGSLPDHADRGGRWGSSVPWSRYLRGVPALRRMVEKLRNAEAVRGGPFESSLIGDAAEAFLRGDDRLEHVIRRLLMVAIWHGACIRPANLPLRAARAGSIRF
jgi:asparagine synthase (glutamine-hydrolysing)